MSSVTISGSSAWICYSASCPWRAVPTTRNSPLVDRISLTSFRMNALSSTTRTVRWLEDTLPHLERLHHDAAIADVEVHASPMLAACVRSNEWDVGQPQHALGSFDVALAHIDAAGRQQRSEHACSADDLGHRPSPRAALSHLLDEHWYRCRRELRAVLAVEGQAFTREQNVREPAD